MLKLKEPAVPSTFLFICAVAFTIGGLVLWSGASSEKPSAAEVERGRLVEMVQIRADASRIFGVLLLDELEAELTEQPVQETVYSEFDRQIADVMARATALIAGHSDTASTAAARFIDVYTQYDFGERPYDTVFLDELSWGAATSDTNETLGSVAAEFTLLAMLETPSYVLQNVYTHQLAQVEDLSPHLVELFDANYDYSFNRNTWFGPEISAPYNDSWFATSFATEAYSAVLDQAGSADGMAVLWTADQWLVDEVEAQELEVDLADLRQAHDDARAVSDQLLSERLTAGGADCCPSSPAWFALLSGGALLAVIGAVGSLVALGLESVRRLRHMREAGLTDALTGARNRHFVDSTVARWCRQDRSHTVCVVDLNRFKMINDTWGHPVGDQLLQKVTAGLQEALDKILEHETAATGAVIRLGGDEFAITVHTTSPIGDRLENLIRTINGPIDVGGPEPVPLSLSLGSTRTVGAGDIEDMLAAADLACYEDKRASSEPSRSGTRQGVT